MARYLYRIGLAMMGCLACGAVADAQSLRFVRPLLAGECSVVVEIVVPLAHAHRVEIELDGNTIGNKTPASAARFVSFGLKGPLSVDDVLRVREVGPGNSPSAWLDTYTVTDKAETVACRRIETEIADERDGFE